MHLRGQSGIRRAWLVAAAFVCFALLVPAVAFGIGFDAPTSNETSQQFGIVNVQRVDTPNDPDYDSSEPDNAGGATTGDLYSERFDLFGFPSQLTRNTALYREGPNQGNPVPLLSNPMISGFNAAGGWKQERGRSDTVVAVLDTGIKWDKESLRLQVHLNPGELPLPSSVGATCGVPANYDCNNDGAFNVDDYAGSTVSPAAGTHGDGTKLDAEDLIATFGTGTGTSGGKTAGADDDANGFVDDIAGWDFFDNDNNPYDASSYFAASNHGSGRMEEVAERGNDGLGSIGVCPKCQIMPIRTWDTFVSDGNTFGMGILFGTDNGADVIEGANGSLYHSAFTEAASQYAYDEGVAQTFSGDDLNTANHNYPANYSHAMLIEGTVPDTVGLGQDSGSELLQLCGLNPLPPPLNQSVCSGSNVPVTTYFRGANTTQFGGKSSISMYGPTGSQNTGRAAGAAGLVVSAAADATPPIDLKPDETREILEQTAERVTGGTTGVDGNVAGIGNPDPGANPTSPSEDQWTSHFGWGRVDLGKAVSVAKSGAIPPEAAIFTPDWYAPVTGATLPVTGRIRANYAGGGQFTYRVQWGLGQAPTTWNTVVPSTTTTGTVTDLGSVDLAAVRAAIAANPVPPVDPGGPTLSPTPGAGNPFSNEFTVRVVTTGTGIATPGIDRRVFTALNDPTLRPGYPKRMGTGGEAPLRYADINGDNQQELIVPTEDGKVHAYLPDGSSELTGWPVQTMTQVQAAGHATAPGFAAVSSGGAPPLEPPRAPTIADLDDDGVPEVITAAGTRIYVWEPNGQLRTGFPVQSDLSHCVPALQSQPLSHPKCGFLASPSVARLDGPTQPFSIVEPGLDGYLYVVNRNGGTRAGYPLRLVDPSIAPADQMVAESINEPAVGDLNGDGTDDLVIATNETYAATPPSFGTLNGLVGGIVSSGLANAAGGSERTYAINGATGQYLPGWPIAIDGAIQTTLPFIGPGQSPSIAKIGGSTRVVASATGSATVGKYTPLGVSDGGTQQAVYGATSDATDRLGSINLFESASIGKLLPGGGPSIVKYGASLADVANLLLVGQNFPYNHLIGAYDGQTGAPLPAFPRVTDDFQFLSSSTVANVSGTPQISNQVIAGTGLGLLHAYDGVTGLDATGFPKVTGGWLFAPAAVSDDDRVADITREGYLFEWNHAALPQCQTEWPSFRHDQQGSGNYDRDGTQPYKPTAVSATPSTLSFTAPGDDYGCGTADRFQIVTSDNPIDPSNFAAATALLGPPAPAPAGTAQTYTLPSTVKRYVAIRAVDEAGNVGWAAQADRGNVSAPSPSADVTVSIADSPDPVTVGQPLTYMLSARNLGPGDPGQSTVVTDTLPPGVTFVSATSTQGTCTQASGTVTCNLGTLNAGAANDATITIQVTPQAAGMLSDSASITSLTNDPTPGNNSDSETTQVNVRSGPTGSSGPNGPTAPLPGPCANLQRGDGRANTLEGTGAGDRLLGFGRADKLFGLGANDCVNGGTGNDKVSGGTGNDKVVGQRGRDTLSAGPGTDTLYGNGGKDHLFGGPGKDRLLGGIDQDVLTSKGGGKDVVDCGVGRHDVAIVDRSDKVRRCEVVKKK